MASADSHYQLPGVVLL